ncbi:AMP-binding protein [Litoreibacter janthinus]|uniref:Long-chain acyl-CoA synthetase (AMP-forming) n=1 Tax=Litoreibacter janthinus TaxID=670154 RepID=A0A1I6H2U0_9RHOB|nr:AMP-binding protein [Litoreibacter janthinus]SFR48671.1 Long-chain acyl-CoA synthetase (AMP-forming) [Litoreibacter janthinus]
MKQVFEALAKHKRTRPDDIAFSDDQGDLTWAELSARVENLASQLGQPCEVVAIGLAGGIDYVVADLAASLAGKRQIPLPFFFSTAQNAHILFDAKVDTVITKDPDLFAQLPHLTLIDPASRVPSETSIRDYSGGSQRVIYTSGSSGTPKGVVLGDRQIAASIEALSRLVAASPNDHHLSVLPLAQLLEQICGVFLPIVAGARTSFRFEATKALFGAPIGPLVAAFEEVAPTTSLVAPALLARWAGALKAHGSQAPSSLRFVAVGGASTAPALIQEAQSAGIPVHEGYGLSECCAVVAMNRPGDNYPGTVGPVLDGLDVRIVQGEIVVQGPTVMAGYLNAPDAPERWHTGDLGHFAGDRLVIDGRKDALLITGAGRNVSPEWVEQRLNADPRVVSSALGLRKPDGALILILVTTAIITPSEVERALADLPQYARPAGLILTDPSEPDLLFPVRTPNRKVAAQVINSRTAIPLSFEPESMAS